MLVAKQCATFQVQPFNGGGKSIVKFQLKVAKFVVEALKDLF